MLKVHKYPAVRILIFALFGITIGLLINWSYPLLIFLIIIILALNTYLFLKSNYSSTFAIFSFSIGLLISFNINYQQFAYPDKVINEIPALFDGNITSVLKKDSSNLRCLANGKISSKYLPEMNTTLLVSIYSKNSKIPDIFAGYSLSGKLYIRPPKKKQLLDDFFEEQYLQSLGANWTARANLQNVSIKARNDFLRELLEVIRTCIANKIKILFSEDTAPIVSAILTGDQSSISSEIKQQFSMTGIAHILSVSGLHTGVIGGIIFLFTSYFRSRGLRMILFGVLMLSFIIFIGAPASAVRAGIICFAIVFAWYIQRKYELINLLALAALLMLIFQSNWLFSIGFQLSYLSFAGIVLFNNLILTFFKRFFKSENPLILYILSSISVTLAASITVTALVAYYFNIFSLISPFINLFAVPAISLALIYSLVSVILSFIFTPIAEIFARADVLIKIIFSINEYGISISGSYFSGRMAFVTAILFSIASIYIFYSKTKRQAYFRIVSSISIGLLFFFIFSDPDHRILVLPREKTVVIMLPPQNNKTAIVISDRMPRQYPQKDIALEKYIASLDDTIILAYTGNCGIVTIDNIRKSFILKQISKSSPYISKTADIKTKTSIINNKLKIHTFHIDNDFQKELSRKLKLKKYLPQIVDYKD